MQADVHRDHKSARLAREAARAAARGPECAARCGYALDRRLAEDHGHTRHITCPQEGEC